MKNIKQITLSVFAIIGFYAVVSGFTKGEQKVKVNYETPKTHVWEIYGAEKSFAWLLNKETGKVYGLDAERRARVKLRTIDKRKIEK
ncbi:hypothetical protein N9484_04190 [Polaribacter sp.]|nr:hypothetical protein [Polaribacter sp.]MDB4182415.1 hypothetical protein [Polaribacter sp.]